MLSSLCNCINSLPTLGLGQLCPHNTRKLAMAEVEVISKEATAGDNRIQLSSCAEYQTYTCNEQACWAMASFKAPFYEPTSRPSVDIVAVIDKSGSMRGVKLDLVKKTLLFVIDQCEYYHLFSNFT